MLQNHMQKLPLKSMSNLICTHLFRFLFLWKCTKRTLTVYFAEFCTMWKVKNDIVKKCLISLCFSKNVTVIIFMVAGTNIQLHVRKMLLFFQPWIKKIFTVPLMDRSRCRRPGCFQFCFQ